MILTSPAGGLGYSSAQASAALGKIVAREGDGVKTETLNRMGLRG